MQKQLSNISEATDTFSWNEVHNDLGDVWDWFYITIAGVWLLVGVPGNLMVIVACVIFERMRNIPAMLIANLAVSDLFVCVSNVASTWVSFFHDQTFFLRHPKLCAGNGFICGLGCFCSMACICTIAVNRYIAICNRTAYEKVYNYGTLPFHVMDTWLAGVVIMAPALFNYDDAGFAYDPRQILCTRSYLIEKGHSVLQWWETSISMPVATFIMVFTYSKIFSKARQSSKNMQKWNKDGKGQTPCFTPRDLKLMKTLLIMFSIFMVANGPWFAVMLLDFNEFHHSWYYLTTWLFHSASAINPVIYAARYPEFQECFKRMIHVMTFGACFRSNANSAVG